MGAPAASPEKVEKALDLLRRGYRRATASKGAGCSRAWINERMREDEEFREKVWEAEAHHEAEIVECLREAAENKRNADWKAYAYLLEKRHGWDRDGGGEAEEGARYQDMRAMVESMLALRPKQHVVTVGVGDAVAG